MHIVIAEGALQASHPADSTPQMDTADVQTVTAEVGLRAVHTADNTPQTDTAGVQIVTLEGAFLFE